ncbi:MAG: branched-chain amino acid ABC transporter permease [Solirubrobacterales bacterium]|nr:branched-chain amino acid ABC transporter permease [Solirubrobacterales bacterium]
MSDPLSAFHLAVSFSAFTDIDFWTSVGILAGTYAIFATGLQMNVGFTGIFNFGQVGFMAIGAYSMAILTAEHGVNFWLSLPISILIAIGFGLIIGLPSLRLRADYFAIATIAAAEAIRLVALNARDLTNGPQGIFGFDNSWNSVSDSIEEFIVDLGWTDVPSLFPLFLVTWVVAIVLIVGFSRIQRTPWGRVLRAIREDEDAARALGKNAFSYKLQSLAFAATTGALAGFVLALNLKFVVPDEFQPLVTFIGYVVLLLGGLANYWGVVVGSVILWTVLEGMRFVELPLSETKIAALRFMILGVVLIGLMAFRPQGAFGKREEMVLGD